MAGGHRWVGGQLLGWRPRLEAIARRLEAITGRLEALASRWRPSLLGLLGWRPLLLGWRPLLSGWRP